MNGEPTIYGFEQQARCLASQQAVDENTELIRFFVGTMSLKGPNEVYVVEFDDEESQIGTKSYNHPKGEIHDLSTSYHSANLLSTCYNSSDGSRGATIWRIGGLAQDEPVCSDIIHDTNASYEQQDLNDEYSQNQDTVSTSNGVDESETLQEVFTIDGAQMDILSVVWSCSDDNYATAAASVERNVVQIWDLQKQKQSQQYMIKDLFEGNTNYNMDKFKCFNGKGRWSPSHHNGGLILSAGNSVIGFDVRCNTNSFVLENTHFRYTRDVDFNPNKQFDVATAGDDGSVNIWDIRNNTQPLKVMKNHTHWVWSVRYNQFHDQLILSSSSDTRVILSNDYSISSYAMIEMNESGSDIDDDYDGIDGGLEQAGSNEINSDADSSPSESFQIERQPEGIVKVYEEHEDSVYAVEWSSVDPWLFASLSHDGRLVINSVPDMLKYSILL